MSEVKYDINYDDERFQQVENDKQNALTNVENTYNSMIDQTDKFYQEQIDASKEWANTQSQIQNEQTDLTIEKLEQQKEKAEKDYQKEQSGAYVDWKKQSNAYGAKAEEMAANGMAGSGYSESSQVAMYNSYQVRVAAAREVLGQATLNFDNSMKEARLQNSVALAEIAFEQYQKELELGLQGFQYKNSLLSEKENQLQAAEDRYYVRWQNVLAQINQENALAEQIRQYNENMAYQKEQDAQAQRNWQAEFDLAQAELAKEQTMVPYADAQPISNTGNKTGFQSVSERLNVAVNNKPESINGEGVSSVGSLNSVITGGLAGFSSSDKVYKTESGRYYVYKNGDYIDITNKVPQKPTSTGGVLGGGGTKFSVIAKQ